jgi:hypothetical protein
MTTRTPRYVADKSPMVCVWFIGVVWGPVWGFGANKQQQQGGGKQQQQQLQGAGATSSSSCLAQHERASSSLPGSVPRAVSVRAFSSLATAAQDACPAALPQRNRPRATLRWQQQHFGACAVCSSQQSQNSSCRHTVHRAAPTITQQQGCRGRVHISFLG